LSDRESDVTALRLHLADADLLSQDKIVETIRKEFDQPEDEEREPMISEPKITS
jgi:hypothetical protein